MPSLSDFFGGDEQSSRTLFTILKNDALVAPLIAAPRSVVGDLDQPDRGLLVALPEDQTQGLDKKC